MISQIMQDMPCFGIMTSTHVNSQYQPLIRVMFVCLQCRLCNALILIGNMLTKQNSLQATQPNVWLMHDVISVHQPGAGQVLSLDTYAHRE